MDNNSLQATLAEKLSAFEQTAKPKLDSNLGKKGTSKNGTKEDQKFGDNFSLLSDRRSRMVFPTCVVIYLSMQLIMLRNAWPCQVPLGRYSVSEVIYDFQDTGTKIISPFSPWVRYVDLFAAISFTVASVVNIYRWLQLSEKPKESVAMDEIREEDRREAFIEQRNIYEAALSINIIAATSAILTYTHGAFGMYTGVCSDIFGVETPSPIWSEYLVAVPLLVYIAIAMEQKSSIQTEE